MCWKGCLPRRRWQLAHGAADTCRADGWHEAGCSHARAPRQVCCFQSKRCTVGWSAAREHDEGWLATTGQPIEQPARVRCNAEFDPVTPLTPRTSAAWSRSKGPGGTTLSVPPGTVFFPCDLVRPHPRPGVPRRRLFFQIAARRASKRKAPAGYQPTIIWISRPC